MREMVYCMAQYPPETVFFLETWCWGWEEVIIAVAQAFQTKVSTSLELSDSRCTLTGTSATCTRPCQQK